MTQPESFTVGQRVRYKKNRDGYSREIDGNGDPIDEIPGPLLKVGAVGTVIKGAGEYHEPGKKRAILCRVRFDETNYEYNVTDANLDRIEII
ncbi:MAG: hypothetical protein ACJ8FY_28965 [Gemmataceae bacterium]